MDSCSFEGCSLALDSQWTPESLVGPTLKGETTIVFGPFEVPSPPPAEARPRQLSARAR